MHGYTHEVQFCIYIDRFYCF